MAIDICSEISSLSISPRISFSHDLKQLDQQDHHHKHHSDHKLDQNSFSDFDFCVIKNDTNFTFEFPSADELFSDGKILPIQIKNSKPHDHHDLVPKTDNPTKKIRLKEFLSLSYDTDDDNGEEENDDKSKDEPRLSRSGSVRNYMSFIKFRRSSSLNLEKIKSLHFISRSNSTGSTQPNKTSSLRKQQSVNSCSSSSSSSKAKLTYGRSSSFSSYYSHNNSNVTLSSKSFQRKNINVNNSNSNSNNCNGGSQYYGNSNNGVRVTPILNIPQPYISKVTINFFGFGSLFCNGKVRKKNNNK